MTDPIEAHGASTLSEALAQVQSDERADEAARIERELRTDERVASMLATGPADRRSDEAE